MPTTILGHTEIVTSAGSRWVVLCHPTGSAVGSWHKLAKANASLGVFLQPSEEMREAIGQAYKGFQNAFEFSGHGPTVCVAFISKRQLRTGDLVEQQLEAYAECCGAVPVESRAPHLAGFPIEMFVTVSYEDGIPIATHMGISRVFGVQRAAGGVSLLFHGVVASLLRGARPAQQQPLYMVTAPLAFMGAQLVQQAGAQIIPQGQGTPGYVKVRGIVPSVTLRLPNMGALNVPGWLAKLAFGAKTSLPMYMDHGALASSWQSDQALQRAAALPDNVKRKIAQYLGL